MRKLPIVALLLAASLVLLAPMAHANDGGGYWWDEISEPDVVQEDSPDPNQPGPDTAQEDSPDPSLPGPDSVLQEDGPAPNQPGPDTIVEEDAAETVAPGQSSNDGGSGCVLGATTANGVSALVFFLALITGGALSLRSRKRERE